MKRRYVPQKTELVGIGTLQDLYACISNARNEFSAYFMYLYMQNRIPSVQGETT